MANFNQQICITGNLTREPELRYTPSGAAVTKFSVATNKKVKNKAGEEIEIATFFNVVAWRELGENVAESLTTGSRVVVTGEIQTRSWEDKDGTKRYGWDLVADEVAPSLRWATASITKTTRGGPGDWADDGSDGGFPGGEEQ